MNTIPKIEELGNNIIIHFVLYFLISFTRAQKVLSKRKERGDPLPSPRSGGYTTRPLSSA
jgi:hypothetical protein